jgi:tRNA U34 5-methylaminomethyl-2-thiouridine-forming methyltransferase MnmC
MHPGLGPGAEAEALYVRQLNLRERLQLHSGEFVIWDVGLGAAANALTVLRTTRDLGCSICLVSFDNTAEPLAFALDNAASLGYFHGYEAPAAQLLKTHEVKFTDGAHEVNWQFILGDFPAWLKSRAGVSPAQRTLQREQKTTETASLSRGADRRDACPALSAPHAILFDAFSPAKNPAMWTLPLFTYLFRLLDPRRPCALTTYSRSTLFRVTLLLAGFFVGRGHATGAKEETTVAANTLDWIGEPLDRHWLERAKRSHSAEPLGGPVYRQAPLSPETWERLRQHPQLIQACASG